MMLLGDFNDRYHSGRQWAVTNNNCSTVGRYIYMISYIKIVIMLRNSHISNFDMVVNN